MNGFAEVVGLAGSIVSLVLWWPQAVRVWRSRGDPRELSAVSVLSQVLLLCNAALWGVYAVATQSLWVGAPGLINAPLAVVTIAILRRPRRGARRRGAASRRGAAAVREAPSAGTRYSTVRD